MAGGLRAPDGRHGVVVQFSSSDRDYPSPEELLATRTRDPGRMPATEGGVEPLWWTGLSETPITGAARLGATHLAPTDLAFSRDLFQGCSLPGSARERAAWSTPGPGGWCVPRSARGSRA